MLPVSHPHQNLRRHRSRRTGTDHRLRVAYELAGSDPVMLITAAAPSAFITCAGTNNAFAPSRFHAASPSKSSLARFVVADFVKRRLVTGIENCSVHSLPASDDYFIMSIAVEIDPRHARPRLAELFRKQRLAREILEGFLAMFVCKQ